MNLKQTKFFAFILAVVTILTLTACSRETPSQTFPGISDADLPDVLEKIVGTKGDVYFTSFGKTVDTEYRSYLSVTFEDTTEADVSELMEHYQAESTGTDEDGNLLFGWGYLLVEADEHSISVQAWII